MVEFQVEFLKTLEDGTRLVPDLEKLESVDQFKVQLNLLDINLEYKPHQALRRTNFFFDSTPSQKILFSLGGSFLYYADRFKIYSAFCASHTKVPKVLVKSECMFFPHRADIPPWLKGQYTFIYLLYTATIQNLL